MDDDQVAGHADRRRDQQCDHEPEHEASGARRRLRHRTAPGGDEQRQEDAEADQVSEREVDDAGKPVNEGVPDPDQPVDAARREAREDDLDPEAHSPARVGL